MMTLVRKCVRFISEQQAMMILQHIVIRLVRSFTWTDAKNENWIDPMTAGALSRYILWNPPTLQASTADYARRFGLKRA